jgi:hypothetical protein
MKIAASEMLVVEDTSMGTILVTISDGYLVLAQGQMAVSVDEVEAIKFANALLGYANRNAVNQDEPRVDIVEGTEQ